jgi:hypothetical protein
MTQRGLRALILLTMLRPGSPCLYGCDRAAVLFVVTAWQPPSRNDDGVGREVAVSGPPVRIPCRRDVRYSRVWRRQQN